MGVNATPPMVGTEGARGAAVPPSAGDGSCAEGPAFTLDGIAYPCKAFVPGLPALTSRARVINGRQHRVRARADQRAVILLLRQFVALVVVDPHALPPRWWRDPALLEAAQGEATRLLMAYDPHGRAVA